MNNLELGEYDTEEEAAYAYNVGMLYLDPDCSPNKLNHGMNLTAEQKQMVEDQVMQIMRRNCIYERI